MPIENCPNKPEAVTRNNAANISFFMVFINPSMKGEHVYSQSAGGDQVPDSTLKQTRLRGINRRASANFRDLAKAFVG